MLALAEPRKGGVENRVFAAALWLESEASQRARSQSARPESASLLLRNEALPSALDAGAAGAS